MLFYLFNKFLKYEAVDLILIYIYLFCILLCILWREPVVDSTEYILNNYFIHNSFNNGVKKGLMFCMLCYLILLNTFNNIIKVPMFEYLIIILTCLFSILIIIKSNHLFIIFLFLEVINICLYCLIGLNKDSNMGIESAYKYFVQSSFATIIGFFGISLLYIFSGTLFLNELHLLISCDNLNVLSSLGIYLIITSIFFKLGLFPLHSWIADIYQGTLLISLVFIAIIPKIAYVILFLKLYIIFNSIIYSYSLYVASLSIIYGACISLYQTSFKRLLAYGSMVHIGLIIISISVFTIQSITASLFYLGSYICLMFFVFIFMFFLFEKKDEKLIYLDDISKFNIYFSHNRLLTIYFSLILFSLAGLPFFIGFIAKWYLFLSLIDTFYVLEVLLLLSVSVLSSSYYIRVLRFLYFSSKAHKIQRYAVQSFNTYFFSLIYLLYIVNIVALHYYSIALLIIFKYVLLLFI